MSNDLNLNKIIEEKRNKCNSTYNVNMLKSFLNKAKQSKQKPLMDFVLMSNEKIEGLNLERILISSCVFENVFFTKVNFSNACLVNSIFVNCHFEQCKGAVNFEKSVFNESKFFGCEFSSSSYVRCVFEDFILSNSNVKNSNFSLSNYKAITIQNSNYENTLLELKNESIERVTETNLKAQYHLLLAASSLLEVGLKLNNGEDLNKELSTIKAYVSRLSEAVVVNKYKSISQEELDEILEEHDRKVELPVKQDETIYLDLRNYDFSGLNLQEHNLTGMDFSNSNFENSILAGCTCFDCNFSNCILDNAIMYGAKFMRNDFNGASLKNIVIDKNNFKILADAGLLLDDRIFEELNNFHNDIGVKEDFDEIM